MRDFSAVTAAEVAGLFGITVQALDAWRRTGCPCSKEDGRRSFDLGAVIRWRRERDQAMAPPAGLDPALIGDSSGSPALERYRLAKAKSAELDLQLRKGQVIEVVAANRKFQTIARRLREAFETLERKFGREVGEELRLALSSAQKDFERE
jgi:phage terminase Nu1 subunit (DNA packaging protein)